MYFLRRLRAGNLGLSTGPPALLLGFLATAFQIYLLREFSVHFYGNELTFGFVLGAWLLWGGIGSLVGPKLRLRPERLPEIYTATIGLFFAGLILLRFSHRLLGALPGELTGLVPALAFALVLALFISFPLGLAFVLNAALLGGDAPRVYLLESLGAALAGLAVHLLLVPGVSNWTGAALIAAAAGLLILLAFRQPNAWRLFAGTLAAAFLFAAADMPSLKSAWKPFALVAAEDTPHGKLQVLKTGDQFSFYSNGLALFSYPDTEAAEESVHFAMLQRPGAQNVLLIGGGISGGCAEILKYPGTRVDYVEINPAIIRLAERRLPEAALAPLKDPRVTTVFEDGRAFLERTDKTYDAILLNLPEPATAQINRFYTREFYAEAKKKLGRSGVLSFIVPSAENYINRDLQQFLESLDRTLRDVFPNVVAVPGENNVFLASAAPLSVDAGTMAASLERLGIHNTFVSPEMLPTRLAALRIDYLKEKIRTGAGLINKDLVPVSYYFNSILWAAQFKGLESGALRLFSRIPGFWILDAPLVVVALALAFGALKKRRSPARFLVPVAFAGFSSILVEIAVLIVFQSSFGYVYGKISLLLCSFMAGLAAGSFVGMRWKRHDPAGLAAAQGALAAALFLVLKMAVSRGPEALPFLALAGVGALSGYLFVVGNRLFLKEVPRPGTGYGVDLLASFVGVILASSFVIPLFGVPLLLGRLVGLNILGFLFTLTLAAVPAGPGP